MSDNIVIGIDLGTTNSCAAYYFNGEVISLENEDGNRTTPSFVFFNKADETVVVGKYAKKMSKTHPENGIGDVKRLIGRKFDDPRLQEDLQYFSFKVVDDCNEPIVIIENNTETLKKTPQELCTHIFAKIKKYVEAKLGYSIEKVVITVPANFNLTQRELTLAAAYKAGFVVLKLLNEPTAAALRFFLKYDCKTENYALVYDLGGGTFDVSILKRNSSNLDIVSTDGDTHLGGKNFDNIIIEYVCNELEKNYKYNPKSDKRTMRRLHNECEKAKKTLSTLPEVKLILTAFVNDHDIVEITLTRDQFETMADELFKKTINIVGNCLRCSGISKIQIDEVILSGGSTRIPKIQTMLSAFFDGKKLNKFSHPDECVAEGAAIQGAMLSKNLNQKIDKIQIVDVTPLSLGTDGYRGKMVFLIRKNTPIPTSQKRTFYTVDDQQTKMLFKVYEGERLNTNKNRCLCSLEFSDLTAAPPGQCKVTLTMTIDHNGILTVKAEEEFRKNIKNVKVSYIRGQRSDKEVKNALKDAEDNKEEDEYFMQVVSLNEYLSKYCISAIHNIEKKNLLGSHIEIYQLCNTLKEILSDALFDDEIVLREWIQEIREACEPIVNKHKFEFMPIYENF